MFRRTVVLVLAMFLVGGGLLGCSSSEVHPFVPLPPPAGSVYPLNAQQVVVGDNAQLMSVVSPFIEIHYKEMGRGAGESATEVVEVSGKKATMLQTVWGDWEKASLQVNEYFATDQRLVRGLITLEFKEMSLLRIFTGRARYTIDKSRLILRYDSVASGWPVLKAASYTELWGLGEGLLFGATAVWDTDLENLLPRHMRWGFWETGGSPANVVKNALETTVASRLAGQTPDFELIDLDSPRREPIGRQTGFHLYEDGSKVGTIELEYRNNWGRQPNTFLIGKGALSKVEWLWDGKYFALLALTPALSPVGSTLYLFVDDPQAATNLTGRDPVALYPALREGEIDHVILAVHAQGDIGSIRSRVVGGEGGSVKVGDQGGIVFRTLGEPGYEDVRLASNLLAMLGNNGLRGLGLYYAYKPGSGSSLCYYLAAMRLILADPEEVLDATGLDVGVLDMVGFTDLTLPPFVE